MSDLYVEGNGSGPDLVLLHGWGLNVRVWDGLVEKLRDRFRLITVDLPGHGRSAWSAGRGTPAEQAWFIHSSLASVTNRYSLLGWSLGAQIALDLAAAMPGQIDKLILVAATPRFAQSPDWSFGMQPSVISKMASQLREDYARTVGDFLELQVRGSADGPNVLAQLRKALLVHGQAKPEALEAGLNILATSDLRPTLPHVKVPTLVIAGQHDRITPPAASHALAEALPDGRYVEIRRAAHAPFLSHRNEFATVAEQFLRGADVARTAVAAATPTAATARAARTTVSAPTAPAVPAAPAAATAPSAPAARGPRAAPIVPVAAAAHAKRKGGAKTRKQAKKKRLKARARKRSRASSR